MELLKLPDPRLKQNSKKVVRFGRRLELLFKEMQKMMLEEGGIGLAAPQVGVSERFIIVGKPGLPMANPVIVSRGKDWIFSKEACLSCPDLGEVDVFRATKVTVEFQRFNGSKATQQFDGMTAFVVQHEIDHLDGITLEDVKQVFDGIESKAISG